MLMHFHVGNRKDVRPAKVIPKHFHKFIFGSWSNIGVTRHWAIETITKCDVSTPGKWFNA